MTIAKIFSTLGNPKSLVPLAIKDSANSTGMTISSTITSKDEGVDRFIDEFGTETIWLGAIPLYKKVTDKTLFKFAGYDAEYDVRNLKNKDIFEKTKEFAPDINIQQKIDKIGKNKSTFKGLNVIKFAVSTLLALGTYNVMTDLKQKYTHNKIKTKLLKEKELNKNSITPQKPINKQEQQISKTNNSPNFKGGFDIMLDPVKNMMILDGGITTERLVKSRSPQEFAGYAIKEGGFLFFMYVLGQKIQNHFENSADKKHNKNIGLDARVLEDNNFKKSFEDKSIEIGINSFNQKMTDVEVYEYIHKNPESPVVKAAKQSDIIQTYKKPKAWYKIFTKAEDSGKIDTRKFIDIDEVRNTHKNISKLYNQFNNSGQNADDFFKDVRKLKRSSIMKNIGSTIFALGVVLPAIMLADRLLKPNNKEFAVEKAIKAQLEAENKLQG